MIDFQRQDGCLDFLTNKKICSSSFSKYKIGVVGCGGVGSIICELLSRGGFNNLILFDADVVDKTNLQRQIFVEKDIGKFKVNSIKKRILDINSNLNVKTICEMVTKENLNKFAEECDFIIDATDNVESRLLIDEFCKENKIIWIYLGAILAEIVGCVIDGKNSCFSKIMNKNTQTESCSIGVLASTTYSSASLGYNLLLKYILTQEHSKLVKINLWNNKIFEIDLS